MDGIKLPQNRIPKRVRVGETYQVCFGSGLDSDRIGVVISVYGTRIGRAARLMDAEGDFEMYTHRLLLPLAVPKEQ